MPMEGTNREAPGGNEDYLKYYDLLKRIGVLDELQHYRNEISNLEEIISQAVELLSKSSIEEVLEVVVQGLMDKFIPSYLTLILQEAGVEGKILVKCYERLREIPPPSRSRAWMGTGSSSSGIPLPSAFRSSNTRCLRRGWWSRCGPWKRRSSSR